MSDPVPEMMLGRLIAGKKKRATVVGRGLLKDAVLRTRRVSQQAGRISTHCKTALVNFIYDAALLSHLKV